MSVAKITAGLNRMVAKLEAHAEKMSVKKDKIQTKKFKLDDKLTEAELERHRAVIASKNIKNLLGN